MSRTRDQQRLIDISNQNASQPIYRLSPELISEIFLHARPDPFAMRDATSAWAELVRYLTDITSITGHLRHIALDYGELWSVVGFDDHMSVDFDNHFKRIIVMKAFLERARRCNLHFFFHGGDFAPSWFHPRLLVLIMPHIGRARTIHIRSDCWERLCVMLYYAVNVNNLSLSMRCQSPTPPLDVLRQLKELTLSLIPYHESYHEIMKQVEKLDFDFDYLLGTSLGKWLGASVQLKWLRIRDVDYLNELGPTDPNFLVRLESLAYLDVSLRLYPWIAHRLSLPHLRHLILRPLSEPHLEPLDCCYPLLRTLCIVMKLDSIHLLPLIMNPQLEYLEIHWCSCGAELLTLMTELLDPSQELTLPSRATFPGQSLKYFRLISTGLYEAEYKAPLSYHLSSILTKAPHLKLDVVAQRAPPGFEGLVKCFPSQVKCYQRTDSIPLDELYERAQKGYE